MLCAYFYSYIIYENYYYLTKTIFPSIQLQTYINLLVFALLVILLCSVLAAVAYLFSLTTAQDVEKRSEYECGFAPFDSATRHPFEVHFYVVGILFLIFDVEVALLFPWVLTAYTGGVFSFIMMSQFIYVLAIGFLYEWKRGALIWPTKYTSMSCTPAFCLITSVLSSGDEFNIFEIEEIRIYLSTHAGYILISIITVFCFIVWYWKRRPRITSVLKPAFRPPREQPICPKCAELPINCGLYPIYGPQQADAPPEARRYYIALAHRELLQQESLFLKYKINRRRRSPWRTQTHWGDPFAFYVYKRNFLLRYVFYFFVAMVVTFVLGSIIVIYGTLYPYLEAVWRALRAITFSFWYNLFDTRLFCYGPVSLEVFHQLSMLVDFFQQSKLPSLDTAYAHAHRVFLEHGVHEFFWIVFILTYAAIYSIFNNYFSKIRYQPRFGPWLRDHAVGVALNRLQSILIMRHPDRGQTDELHSLRDADAFDRYFTPGYIRGYTSGSKMLRPRKFEKWWRREDFLGYSEGYRDGYGESYRAHKNWYVDRVYLLSPELPDASRGLGCPPGVNFWYVGWVKGRARFPRGN